MLAQALYLLGRSDEALQVLDAKQNLPGAFATAPATALGMAYRSLILHDEGDAAAAARIARSALDVLGEQHLGMGLPAANPLIALGTALGSGPDVISAREHLERAVELTDTAGLGYWKTHALLRLAAVRLRLGDREGAKGDLVQARADLDGLPDTGMLERLYEEANDDLAGRRRRDGYLGEPLSEAEQRVLQHLVDGLTVPQVAHELWLSPNTVKTHRRSIYRKLGASDRDELLARAAGAGVTPTND
jgi:LuxR family maltose regulon positive regulatory protein